MEDQTSWINMGSYLLNPETVKAVNLDGEEGEFWPILYGESQTPLFLRKRGHGRRDRELNLNDH